MPIYEYRCDACHHHFEAQQGMTEPALTQCPECKGPIRRLISRNVLVNFKGSGFYVTDSTASSTTTTPSETPGSKVPSSTDPTTTTTPAEQKPTS